MGRDKAWVLVGGRPLVVRQAERLAEVFDEVLVAAKRTEALAALGLRVVEDRETGHAALFGIRAALAAVRRPIFALAVDLPRFPAGLAAALARDLVESRLPCVAPVVAGTIHGLCAAYDVSLLPEIERRIDGGSLVAECGGALRDEDFWGRWGGLEIFENWNRPEDHEPGTDA
jgi:molybdopterin-guanine dinucleotide biosynthesis protein A